MSAEPYRISSAGDLEVAILHEAHDLMADIITPSLYSVSGEVGDQQATFKNTEAFQLFSIRVSELWSEARKNVLVDDGPSNLSIETGLHWLVPRLKEREAEDLERAVLTLSSWLDQQDSCRFWCGELKKHFEFNVARRQLWNVWANSIKHTFLRLQKVTRQVSAWCAKSGEPVSDSDVLYVFDAFEEWLSGYCVYHSTMVAELVGRVFHALYRVIVERWEANDRSNDGRIIHHPKDCTGFFRDLHTSVLGFHRYSESRIVEYVPSTSRSLQKTYPS